MKTFKQYLTEATWTDYYDKIGAIDFNPSTGSSKYKNRKDLEDALIKTYKWDVKSPDVKEAIDRYFAESTKVVTESKKVDDRKINFENIAGGIEIRPGYDGYYVLNYSGGNGYNQGWKSDKYQKLRSDKDYVSIDILREKIIKDLVPVCDRFDRELEAVMKKYGFKK